ncbi:uncharacterized protein STEHIDRAFT_119799 [Stereum hirsutum FP-91666 SS1]|uniref:uncharacterized protein n=1 Tax=Stereum hirsutum (strain FP-91666) TaxID=721885 RepID=UPI000440C819|nr:uncharacterized protein STEHIDRAFT_119799 [Stereum hirsutum FP-91666 SS1]EIM89037.1 hypothetical protein STEHIDRAFT_119799 [Stereum hirsutum FP-91666 SS1]
MKPVRHRFTERSDSNRETFNQATKNKKSTQARKANAFKAPVCGSRMRKKLTCAHVVRRTEQQ